MKVVHVVESTATGTLSMLSLIANLNAQSDEVSVIYSLRPETPNDLPSRFDARIRLIHLQMDGRNKVSILYKLSRLLRKVGPDVVFLHSSYAGFLGRLSLALTRHPKIYYIPHCISFMRKDINFLTKFLFVVFEWIACVRHATYLACSKSELNEIKKNLPFSKVQLLENALEFNPHNGTDCSVVDRKKVVITVGQIRVQKNPRLYADIARVYREVDNDVEFIWIGDGDQQLKEYLLTNGVKVTGWVTREDVYNLTAEAGVYLSTASWEGMPVAIIEAQRCFTPVVATDCAGNVDVIDDASTGFIFRTVDEAITNIKIAFERSGGVQDMVLRAAMQSRTRFSVSRYQADVLEIMNGGQ